MVKVSFFLQNAREKNATFLHSRPSAPANLLPFYVKGFREKK